MLEFLTVYEVTVPENINIRSYEPPDLSSWRLVYRENRTNGQKIRTYTRVQGRHDLFYFARHCALRDTPLPITTLINNQWIPDMPGRLTLVLTHSSGFASACIVIAHRARETPIDRQRRILTAIRKAVM
jgi:hypothetical protein